MIKIDLKDRKILYELDLNCRQSNTQIGKKVGLKKDVVSYRLKKLQDAGIIKNYWTTINTFKLGYDVFRVYINFQYVNNEKEKEIIDYFVNTKNIWAVISDKVEIDLTFLLWVKNIDEFYQFWNKTLDKYEDYFEKYAISIYVQAHYYKKSFLLPEKSNESGREIGMMNCGDKNIKIDQIDYALLNYLTENARMPLIELSEKLGLSSQSINYRIKNLIKNKIILGFRVNLDLSKLDLQTFKMNIYLKDHKIKKQIFDYLKDKPYLEYMNLALGWADLEPEFTVKNLEELLQIQSEIDAKFPNAIKKQSFFIAKKLHKLRLMPELSF
jgi:Lrp/AsnC family leucine-responsive transcriptional regulator